MAYNKKKCSFINLNKDALKPLAKRPKTKNEKASQRSRELTMWRNGWFKGQYEKSTKSHESSN